MMVIYNPLGVILLEVEVSDRSNLYKSIGNREELTLIFSIDRHVDIPVGSWCDFDGSRYEVMSVPDIKMINTKNYSYTVVFLSAFAKASLFKVKNTADGRLKFDMTAKPIDHLNLIVENLNERDGGWSVGSCVDAVEKTISYNHVHCDEALRTIADSFETEIEISEKEISLRKVEYYKDAPLELAYGKGNGFRQGIQSGGYNGGLPTERMFVQGGSRNISLKDYGSKELHLPKSFTFGFDGSYFDGESGYDTSKAKSFETDEKGFSIRSLDVASGKEDSIDLSEIYPSRESGVSDVILIYKGKEYSAPLSSWTDEDWNDVQVDIVDDSIPDSLDYNECLLENNEPLSVVFQSGMLAGREFSANYISDSKRFELHKQELDGYPMPQGTFLPEVGDAYAVFNVSLPSAYISDPKTYSGAEFDALREAARSLYGSSEVKFSFSGEIDGIWSKKNWEQVGPRIRIGSYVRFVHESMFPDTPATARIIGITQYVNNPHSPKIEISNATGTSSLSARLNELENQEAHVEELHEESRRYAKRRFSDVKQTIQMLSKAFDNFSEGINPITVETMLAAIGDESLQYIFTSSIDSDRPATFRYSYNGSSKVFSVDAAFIKHMTLGIDSVSPVHQESEYKRWSLPAYSSKALEPDKGYYLYAVVPVESGTGDFTLEESPVKIDAVDGYYYLLVGILNKENLDKRSFASLYGFTEILPGQITTDTIKSADGNTWLDLLKGILYLNNMAGVSGVKTESKGDQSIAAWFGGLMKDRELDEDTEDAAKSVIRHDGTGYFADGLFKWDKDKGINLGNGEIKINYDGSVEFGENIKISSEGDETLGSILTMLAVFNDMFYFHDDNTIGTKYNFFSEKTIASGDKGKEGEGSGSGVVVLEDWSKYDATLPQVLGAALGLELHNRLTAVEEGQVDIDLSAYATIEYVMQAINDLVNGAPEALDTLREIADALKEDDDAIAAIINTLSTKASKDEVDALKAVDEAIQNKVTELRAEIDTLKIKHSELTVSFEDHERRIKSIEQADEVINNQIVEIKKITDLFHIDTDGNIYVDENFYSLKTVASGDKGAVGTGGTGTGTVNGIVFEDDLDNVFASDSEGIITLPSYPKGALASKDNVEWSDIVGLNEGTSSQFLKGDGSLDSTKYVGVIDDILNVEASNIILSVDYGLTLSSSEDISLSSYDTTRLSVNNSIILALEARTNTSTYISFANSKRLKGYIGFDADGLLSYQTYNGINYSIIHTGNVLEHIGDSFLPLSGGTINGDLSVNRSGFTYISYYKDNELWGRLGFSASGWLAVHNNVDWRAILHEGNYSNYALPLTGGTVKGKTGTPITVDTTNNASEVNILFRVNSSGKAYVGWSPNAGAYIFNNANYRYIGILDDGTPFYGTTSSKNTLIHSGNYATQIGDYYLKSTGGTISNTHPYLLHINNTSGGDSIIQFNNEIGGVGFSSTDSSMRFFHNGSGYPAIRLVGGKSAPIFRYDSKDYDILHSGNANKADVPWTASNILFPGGTSATWNVYTIGAYKGITVLNAVQAKPEGAPGYYAVGLSVSGYYGFTLASLGADDVLLYRRKNDTDWRTIAFTDSDITGNAATATDADQLDGKHLTDIMNIGFDNTLDLDTLYSESALIARYWVFANSSNISNQPWSNSAAQVWTLPGNYNLQIAKSYNSNDIRLRGRSGEDWTNWQQLAFTDSNVASATKLETTRTIWGQSFDGTGNVSGDMFGTYFAIKDRSTNPYLLLSDTLGSFLFQVYQGKAYLGVDAAKSLIINSSGNATIGAGDFAGTEWKSFVAGNSFVYGYGTRPALGEKPESSFSVGYHANGRVLFGLHTWVESSGNALMQVGRTDGTATAYNLVLNPLGGNVGIGTTNPQYKLDVSGTGHFTGAMTLDSTLTAGATTLDSLTVTGWIDANGGVAIPSTASMLIGDAEISADDNALITVDGKLNTIYMDSDAQLRWGNASGAGAYASGTSLNIVCNNLYKENPTTEEKRLIIDHVNMKEYIAGAAYCLVAKDDWVSVSILDDRTTSVQFDLEVKGAIKIGDASIEWDSASNALKVTGNMYATGTIASGDVGAEGGGSTEGGTDIDLSDYATMDWVNDNFYNTVQVDGLLDNCATKNWVNANFYDSSQVSDLLDNYLPMTGGSIQWLNIDDGLWVYGGGIYFDDDDTNMIETSQSGMLIAAAAGSIELVAMSTRLTLDDNACTITSDLIIESGASLVIPSIKSPEFEVEIHGVNDGGLSVFSDDFCVMGVGIDGLWIYGREDGTGRRITTFDVFADTGEVTCGEISSPTITSILSRLNALEATINQ